MRTGWHAAVLAAALAVGGAAHAQGYGTGSGRSTGSTGTTGGPGEAGTTTGGTGAGGTASSGTAKGAGHVDEKLQKAVQKLHASNQGEVAAGKAALSAAQSPDVKQFAQRMIDDHSRSDAQLQQVAQRTGISLKGKAFDEKLKDGQEELKEAQAKQGAEFDRAYMKMMVDEHEDDVEDVEKAAKHARERQQTELALFLDTTHRHLQTHLDEAKRVEQSLERGTGRAQGGSSGGPVTAPSSSSRGGEMGPGGAAGAHGGSAGGSGGTHPGSHTDTGGATRPGGSGAVGGGTSGGSTGSSK
jgi:putative membrane protein